MESYIKLETNVNKFINILTDNEDHKPIMTKIWNDIQETYKIKDILSKIDKKKPTIEKESESESDDQSNSESESDTESEDEGCIHILLTGKKKDKPCGNQITKKSKLYCSAHSRYDKTMIKKEVIKNDSDSDSENNIKEKPTCIHILLNGINIGNLCGKNVTKKSKTNKYCLSHFKFEVVEDDVEEIRTIAIMKKETIINQNSSSSSSKSTTLKISGVKNEAIGIKVIKINDDNYIDPITKLIFNLDKKVIGKLIEKKIEKLNKDDIDFCEKQKIEMIN
jgi:hypothetical protein